MSRKVSKGAKDNRIRKETHSLVRAIRDDEMTGGDRKQ
jgi:hypothetical protein